MNNEALWRHRLIIYRCDRSEQLHRTALFFQNWCFDCLSLRGTHSPPVSLSWAFLQTRLTLLELPHSLSLHMKSYLQRQGINKQTGFWRLTVSVFPQQGDSALWVALVGSIQTVSSHIPPKNACWVSRTAKSLFSRQQWVPEYLQIPYFPQYRTHRIIRRTINWWFIFELMTYTRFSKI